MSRDRIQELGHPDDADIDDTLIDDIGGQAGLRGPSEHNRRAVKIHVIGQLRGAPGRIFKRCVVAVDEYERVLGC